MKSRLLIFFLFLSIFNIYASDVKFYNINAMYGISMREMASVCKDGNGFIWASSKTGILRITESDYRIYQLPYKTANIINVKLAYNNSFLIAYTNNEQYNEAAIYLNRALDYHAASADEKSQAEVIELSEYLAYCDYYKDEEESAAEKFRKVAEMHESLNGRLSGGVAKCLRMQGKCLYYIKRYDEAWMLMNQALDIAIQIDNKKQIVACHKQLYYLCREFKRMMNERGDEQASTLFFRESLLHEMYFSEKPRLAELTVRYEALRCDIMQQYYMNKDYDNVIRIATSLDIHDDADPNASCLVYYYKAQAYVKLENYPMAKEAFFREFELRKKYLGWEEEDTILACQNLGVLYSFCNEREEALACFREAYGHEVKKNGEDSEMAQKLLQYISVVES